MTKADRIFVIGSTRSPGRGAAAEDGAELIGADGDRGLRGAEVGGLLGGGVGGARGDGGQRALDGAAVEDIDLVALRLLGQGNLDGVPAVAAHARATHP